MCWTLLHGCNRYTVIIVIFVNYDLVLDDAGLSEIQTVARLLAYFLNFPAPVISISRAPRQDAPDCLAQAVLVFRVRL